MFYCIKILAQCQSFFLYVKHNMSYTNIDTTPILTCTFMYIKDEHQIFELSESMKWISIKKHEEDFPYRMIWFLFKIIEDLIIEFFSKLFFKSQTCWLLNRVGGSWTVHFLIWLSLLKLCVFCLELKYLFVESNLKGIKMLDHSNSDLM